MDLNELQREIDREVFVNCIRCDDALRLSLYGDRFNGAVYEPEVYCRKCNVITRGRFTLKYLGREEVS
jgi:hypothetical protein